MKVCGAVHNNEHGRNQYSSPGTRFFMQESEGRRDADTKAEHRRYEIVLDVANLEPAAIKNTGQDQKQGERRQLRVPPKEPRKPSYHSRKSHEGDLGGDVVEEKPQL